MSSLLGNCLVTGKLAHETSSFFYQTFILKALASLHSAIANLAKSIMSIASNGLLFTHYL